MTRVIAAGRSITAGHPAGQRARPGILRWPAVAGTALAAVASVSAVTGFRLPFAGPAAGFWLVLACPVYLLFTTSAWRGCAPAERLGYSLCAILLLLMAGGLAANTLLPVVGVRHPLGAVPVVAGADALNLALWLVRRRRPALLRWRAMLAATTPAETRLLAGAAAAVVLAVLGANRLNNAAGDQVSLVALGVIVATLALVLHERRQAREGLIVVVVYGLSLALLLMTSLRGWYVTGHDIQTEYRVFQLTAAHGRWNIADFRDSYNACLSITILPTELSRVIQVSNPYIYKVFFQLIFAVCPVLVYAVSRRHWSVPVSVLSAVYFIGFPTFFTDMPFMNRQEIAYLFVCVAILMVTRSDWPWRRRQAGLAVAAVGVELSHYSTMYVFLAALVLSWLAHRAGVLGRRLLGPSRGRRVRRTSWAVSLPAAGIIVILLAAGIAFTWSDLVTGTGGSALTDARSAVAGLVGGSGGARSGDVSYGLLSGRGPAPQAVLNGYGRAMRQARAGAPPDTYPAGLAAARYRPAAVNGSPALPLTGAGRALAGLGVPVAGLNGVLRQAAAKGEQVCLAIGLIAIIASRRLRRQVSCDFFVLCVGCTAVVALVTVLPDLSADYDVLRAFQEALIVVAPVIVTGSLTLFSCLGRARAPAVAAAACLGILASTTGLLPQLTGGYRAQLSLNNSGSYYDIYYAHPQDEAAIGWLQGEPGVLPDGVQAQNLTEQFYFTAPSGVTGRQFITDIYPSVIRRSSWVVLGYSTVRTGRATAFYDGDLLTYGYPIRFLRNTKNLVYDNGGAEIYR